MACKLGFDNTKNKGGNIFTGLNLSDKLNEIRKSLKPGAAGPRIYASHGQVPREDGLIHLAYTHRWTEIICEGFSENTETSCKGCNYK